MSLKIYLDDCAYAKSLVALLQAAGHQVTIPLDAGISGREDPIHFDFARQNGLVLVTKDPDDFEELHKLHGTHPGILAVYQDNDPKRDMTYAEMVRAIANLETAGVAIANSFHILNAWRY